MSRLPHHPSRRPFALVAVVALSVLWLGTVPAAAQNDAITAARFSLVIDGVEIASFSELVGITTEIDAVEYLSNANKEVIYKKLPGKTKPATIVLKRGKNSSLELWAWHEAARRGSLASAVRSATLAMYDTEGSEVARYFLTNAWPSKLEISGLKAGATEVLLETVTLTCDHIQRIGGPAS